MNIDQEQWASNLMQEASETIDVAPVAFVPTPEGRRTPWLGLVAASVASLLSLSFALGWWSADDKQADVPPDSSHQIPSVFGYDAASARQLLEVKGWDVTEVDTASCEPPGRALGTVPQAGGTPTSSRVQLLVSVPADNLGCGLGEDQSSTDRALAWQVIDFARTGSPLEFSDEVAVFVNGRRATMSAAEALLRNKLVMADLVRVISDDASAVRVESGTWTTPLLTTKIDRGDSMCGGLDLPKGFDGRESLLMYTALPAFNQAPTGGCHFLNVFTTDDGAIDGLVLRTGQIDTPEGPTAVVPDVVGFDLASAENQLSEVGFTASVTKEPSCFDGLVVSQTPTTAGPVKAFQEVKIIVGEDRGLNCAEKPAVAAIGALRDFASGDGPPPPLADTVGLYVGNKLIETRSRDQLATQEGWQVCTTYAASSCPISALAPLRDSRDAQPQVPQGGTTPPCVGSLGELPESLANVRDNADLTFMVGGPPPATCVDYWSVQVWLYDAGEITAVNLLLGDP